MTLKDNMQPEWKEKEKLEEFFQKYRGGKIKLPDELKSDVEQFSWFDYPVQNIIYGEKLADKIRTYLNNKETLREDGYKQDRR